MPTSALIAAGLTATEAAIGAFIIKAVASFAVSALLSPKQKNNPAASLAQEASTQTLSKLQAAANWEIVYGQVRKGGTYVFRHVGDPNNGQQQFTQNQQVPAEDPFRFTAGLYNGSVSSTLIELVETTTDENGVVSYTYTPLTQVSGAPAAMEFRSEQGIINFVAIPGMLQYTFNEAQAGANVRVTFTGIQAGGPVDAKRLHLVIVLAAHEVEQIGDIYFDDEVVPLDGNGDATGKYSGHVYVGKHLGASDQTADTVLMQQAPEKWTSAHRLRGHAYIYVRLIKNRDLFPSGVPNISAMVKGKKVYDPRTTLTAWSANAALCQADYLSSATYGLGAGYTTQIDDDALIAAANVDDENVTLAAGGTEDRYTCNGVVNTADKPGEILGRLLSASAGRAVYVNGLWKIHAGAYVAPTLTLDEGDFRGPVRVTTRLSRRDAFNGVKGVYVSPDNHWQPADFPALASATYMAEDNNERIWKDIELPFTTSGATAQRLAKIELLRARQQISVQAPLKLSAYKAEPPEVVGLTFAKFGWSAKAFEIAELRFNFGEALGVDYTLRETASNVYDWNVSEESTVDEAPNTTLPNPFFVVAPGVPQVTETLYELFGFGVKVKATVSWAPAADAQAVSYDLQWQPRDGGVWNEQSGLTTLYTDVLDVEAGTYLFRVRALNNTGVASLWSQVEKTFVGLTAAPANVGGFSVIKTAGFALAQWALADDLDVRIGGSIVIRHSLLTSGATWENGVILNTFPGAAIQGTVPLITGTYMAKFIDSSGNYSATATSFVATEGMVSGFNTVATSTQGTLFTGSKTNVSLDTTLGAIKLDSTTLIDSMTDNIDDWPYIDSLGGVSGTGSYAFTTHIDLTTVATRRFEADITALSYDTADLIDDRLESIDDWDSIDGDSINDCDVILYARTTNDDPAGAPVWGAWTPFFVADFTCRAAQFKLDFVSGASTHNIAVSELTVHVKEPA